VAPGPWRIAVVLLLGLTIALPLAWPCRVILSPEIWLDGPALGRLAILTGNTLQLVIGVLALALPIGVLFAILLERTDLPGQTALRLLVVLPLFIPLPLVVTGWQSLREWISVEWTPWSVGMVWAIWLHAIAGIPWIILIVGLGLRACERDLEEDALLIRPPWWVLLRVTIPRLWISIIAAGLWLAFQTAGEIIITDLMQVRTLAEEVYTQLVGPEIGADPIARAILVSLLGVVVAVVLVLLVVRRADCLVPAAPIAYRPALRIALGKWTWPTTALTACFALLLVGVPLFGLVWRAGLAETPPNWSLRFLVRQVELTTKADGWLVVRSLLVAGISGGLCTAMALVACWLARASRSFRIGLIVLVATAWAMPGPVLGLGLKDLVRSILDLSEGISSLPALLLWHGPSPLPLLIVNFIRFLPFAVALVWPSVHRLSPELFEAARLDGISPGRELAGIVWPLTRGACFRAALAVAILSLGELSAGKIVSTPGADSFAEVIWTQMHYGISADLAARCLVLLVVVLTASMVIWSTISHKEEKVGPPEQYS
jgi:iron(III) transport system permease protein